MPSINAILLVAIVSESLIHGYVVGVYDNRIVPYPSATVMIENTSHITITDENGEYFLEVERGKYTVEFRLVGFLPLDREIVIHDEDTLEVSFKIFGGDFNEGNIITVAARGGGAYVLDDNGSPISDLVVSLPCVGLVDTTDSRGFFYIEPFDSEETLYIRLYDGSIDSSMTISPCSARGLITLTEFGKYKGYLGNPTDLNLFK